jgi:hypothetical protein
MNCFIPISSTHVDPTGALIALGAAAIDVVGGSAEALEPLFQMSNSAFAGEATIELVDGVAQVRARISEELAATKVGKGVYRGFSLALLKGSDRSIRIARIALVDAPDFAKAGDARVLKLSRKQIPMANSPLLAADQVRLMVRQANDRAAENTRISKAANPPPGGWPKQTGEDQHQGTSNTAGGRGRDKAGYGEGTGGDSCMAAIRQAMSQPSVKPAA